MPLTHPGLSLGVSTGGNTLGTTGTVFQQMVFVGSNLTLSQSINGQSATMTISAGAGGGGNFSGGMSTQGNTSGNTGYASQRLNLVGGNNITLSGSTNGGSMSITISAPNLGAGAFSGGVSNLGNTLGSTGVTGTHQVLAGIDGITLSQSTDANGGTVTIKGNQNTLSFWNNMEPGVVIPNRQVTAVTRTLFIFPLKGGDNLFPGDMTVSTMQMMVSVSASTASITQQHSFGTSFALYRISGSASPSTLSLVNSVGRSWTNTTLATSAANNSYIGIRHMTFHSSEWSSQPALSKNEMYFGAWLVSWSSISFNTLNIYGQSYLNNVGNSGTFNAASVATNDSKGFHPYAGRYSATTTGFPASIHISQLIKTGAIEQIPHIIFNNLLSSW